jgi:glycosyltransferase involved in cell wall biosynthesis
MIDIIIAAYNAHCTIEDTLNSILMQSKKDDLNVYIVNDNPVNDYCDIIDKYSRFLNIKELKMKKNMGPGEARNYGIKNSNSKYIIFIDSDDMFFSHYSVEQLYEYIEKNKLDVIGSTFIEEIDDNSYSVKNDKLIWNHGKIYRRSFIEKNNIYFSNEKTNEDMFFNFLLKMCGAKIKFIDDVTYVWQKNDNSITRINEHEYRYTGLYSYNNNISKLIIEGNKRNIDKEEIAKILFFSLLQMYYTYLSFEYYGEKEYSKELLLATSKNRKSYLKYRKYLSNYDINDLLRKEIIECLNTNLEIILLTKISFDDFISMEVNYE